MNHVVSTDLPIHSLSLLAGNMFRQSYAQNASSERTQNLLNAYIELRRALPIDQDAAYNGKRRHVGYRQAGMSTG